MVRLILRTNLRVTGITARPGNVRGALSSALVDRCLPEAQTNPSLLARRASRQIGSERWRVPALNSGRDVLTGDFLLLTSFCLYKQVAAIVLAPSFPGWLAPLTFDPTRFTELVGFIITVTGTWVACSMLNGDYEHPAESARLLEFPVWDDYMQQALTKTCRTWLVSTPVMAAQLVLATAAESGSLVMDDRFTLALPLAASGVGEPFASAAGILGGMLVWRTFYTGFLDWNFFLSYDASSNPTPQDDTKAWWETMAILAVLVMLCASAAALAGYSVNGASTMSLLRIVHSRM